jgi:RimJ/RimL family protein N-acetyltransferase
VDVEPVILSGERISLEPMQTDHVLELCEIGLESELWKWTLAKVGDVNAMDAYVRCALDDQSKGLCLPFITRDKISGRVIGSTRFGNIDKTNRKTEIGWTWIAPRWQRTFVNTEAKLLMLTHAFEVWNCIRVEFKTDALNTRSRAAIARLGAKEEGVFRNHMITESGRFRDSVYFSIIDSEWEAVKKNLTAMLKG